VQGSQNTCFLTVFTVCAACKLEVQVTYLFVLRHFCHDAENDIDELCLKLSLSLKCKDFKGRL